MPVSSFRASGENRYDDLTDLDRVQEQNRQRVEENLLRMHLQQRQADEAARIAAMQDAGMTTRAQMGIEGQRDIANLAESGLNTREGTFGEKTAAQEAADARRFAQERELGGTFQDKASAAEKLQQLVGQQGLDVAKINMGPNQTYADIAKEQFASGAPDRALAGKLAGLKGSLLDQTLGGQEGGVALSPEDRRNLAYGMLGVQRQASPDDIVRAALQARMASANTEDLPSLIEAYKTGDPSKIQTSGVSPKSINEMQQADSLINDEIAKISSFVRANNWRLSKSDRDSVINRAKTAISTLVNAKFPPQVIDRARAKLRQAIQDSLGENGVIFEASGSDALRQAASDQF